MKSPAFPFYPKDWLSDAKVRAMTAEARGVYIDLICYLWTEGTLPRDLEAVARILGLPWAKFRAVWPFLEGCLIATDTGWQQPRLERERAAQVAHRAQRSAQGQAGAAARWGHSPGNAPALPRHSSPAIDPALPADGSASALALAEDQEHERQGAARPLDPPNVKVLGRLIHELPTGLEDEADKKAELAALAARYGVPYDGASMAEAFDRTNHARRRRGKRHA